ncbi:MAG: hypothetical protein HOO06_16700 [Bdellovibrionaceae bacterium]|nr:hypothetical protein [Pseudobdellovibrionaceae bacterium]
MKKKVILIVLPLISLAIGWVLYAKQKTYYVHSTLIRIGYYYNFIEDANIIRPLLTHEEAQNILRSEYKAKSFKNGSLNKITYMNRTALLELSSRGKTPEKAKKTTGEILNYLNFLAQKKYDRSSRTAVENIGVYEKQVAHLKKRFNNDPQLLIKKALAISIGDKIKKISEFKSSLNSPKSFFEELEPSNNIREVKTFSLRIISEVFISLGLLTAIALFYFRNRDQD